MFIDLGRIFDIDLSTRTWRTDPFPENLVTHVLGGRGFNAWFLYHELSETATPTGPNNILLLSNGLFTGTRLPTSSRVHINALSPQTGLLGSANAGGDFGLALRSCRIQSLVIRGRSAMPVYLVIESDTVRFCDASNMWGLDTWETEDALNQQLLDPKAHFMIIGPAGENGVAFGCIMTDHDHAAGRTGMGTVMGSKHLKAIAIIPPGDSTSPPLSPDVKAAVKRYVTQIRQVAEFETVSQYGGAGQVTWADDMGILPTRNYRDAHFDEIAKLDGKHLGPNITRSRGCRGCPIHCKAELRFQTGKYAGMSLARPEFESMLTFGPRCGVTDLETVVYLDNLCSRLGLDSISTGGVMAFVTDLFERGILTLADTDDLELRWGDGDVMETLIHRIAYQRGFGKVLSQGVRQAAHIIGKGAERYAAHVKGLELSTYNPSEIMGTALGYAVASRGGDFSHVHPSLEYRWSPEKAEQFFQTRSAVDIHSIHGKGKLVKWAMIVNAVVDSLGICKVPALALLQDFDLQREAELTSAFLGDTISTDELFRIGERIATLERLFNLRHGATAADDTLPTMFTVDSDHPVAIEPMVQDFYAAMGWDEQGCPLEGALQILSIM